MEAVLAPMKPLRLMLDAAVGNVLLEACTHDENAHIEFNSRGQVAYEVRLLDLQSPCMQVGLLTRKRDKWSTRRIRPGLISIRCGRAQCVELGA